MAWEMEEPAMRVVKSLWHEGSQRLPAEVIKLTNGTAAIVLDIDGVDYILTMDLLPVQRERPPTN